MKIRYPAAVAAAVLTLAACGSSTKTTSETFTSKPMTYAQLMSNSPAVFQLTYTGQVNTTGTFSTGGAPPVKGQHHTFDTKAGNIYAVVTAVPENKGNGNTPATINAAACRYGGTTKVDFKVTGGTGKFARATGTGNVDSQFAFSMPKLKSGKCNLSNSAQPLHTPAPSGTFDGSMHLTLK